MSGDNETSTPNVDTTTTTPNTDTTTTPDSGTEAITLAVNLAGDQVGAGWGRAQRVAVAVIANGRIVSWEEVDVRWDLSHDAQGEGRHHADIVTFLRDHAVEAVVTGHMGPPMANTLQKMGVLPLVNATGDARSAALAAAAMVEKHRSGSEQPDQLEHPEG